MIDFESWWTSQPSYRGSEKETARLAWDAIALHLNANPTFSYRDVVIQVGTSFYQLNVDYDIMLTCSRTGGWELWRVDKLLGGEFSSEIFRILVGSHIICDNTTKDVAKEVQDRFIDVITRKINLKSALQTFTPKYVYLGHAEYITLISHPHPKVKVEPDGIYLNLPFKRRAKILPVQEDSHFGVS